MDKGPSDRYLQQWWRKAVMAVHGDRCRLCGAQPVECHHIIKRRYSVLRHDWRNGIPLCAACHSTADTIKGRQVIASYVDVEYLEANESWTLKDWLVAHHATRAEFLSDELEELKAVVANPALYREWLR